MSLTDRRIREQHARGDHRDCVKTDCPWWRLPEWVRKAQSRDLTAKELFVQ